MNAQTGAMVVLKIGGRALESGGAAGAGEQQASGAYEALGADLASLRVPVVVVHGGGAEVSQWCERLGVEQRFLDGLRVTDPATLEVATAVLAGLANKRLVAGLRNAGVDAVGRWARCAR